MQFFRPPVTSSLLGPNILISTLFTNILSLCSSLNAPRRLIHQLLSFIWNSEKCFFDNFYRYDRQLPLPMRKYWFSIVLPTGYCNTVYTVSSQIVLHRCIRRVALAPKVSTTANAVIRISLCQKPWSSSDCGQWSMTERNHKLNWLNRLEEIIKTWASPGSQGGRSTSWTCRQCNSFMFSAA
jgi:hypothetical protein